MYFYQSTFKTSKLPLGTRISLVLGIAVSLCLLFFFAFTIFAILLLAGAVLFVLHLFQKAGGKIPGGETPVPSQPRQYRPSRLKDNDVIDI